MDIRQETLNQAHVMVVGCGALGNEVLKNLVLMGIGHLTVVDMDRVEASNLTRSILFRKSDVGRPKVEVVRQRLLELNPQLDIRTLEGNIVHDIGLAYLAQADVVVGCVDNRWARFVLNRHCMRLGKPWVDGGITLWEGTARVFRPGCNCYACQLSPSALDELRRRLPCSGTIRRMEQQGSAPTTSILASMIGAVQVQETLRLLAGNPDEGLCGKLFSYEGDVMSTRLVHLQSYDEDCPEHERWSPVEPSGWTADTTVGEVLKQVDSLTLREDVFVQQIVSRRDNSCYPMLCPGRLVTEHMDSDPRLQGRLLNDFYQEEYRVIDRHFPNPELTLRQLGIPAHDIVPVSLGGQEHYMEL